MVWDPTTVSLGQVAAKQATDYSESGTDDHKKDAGCDLACKVGEEEDDNACVHEDCQHYSRDALRHVSTSLVQSTFQIAGCAVFLFDSSRLENNPRQGCESLTVPHIVLQQTGFQP
jgi:hypothetical protein